MVLRRLHVLCFVSVFLCGVAFASEKLGCGESLRWALKKRVAADTKLSRFLDSPAVQRWKQSKDPFWGKIARAVAKGNGERISIGGSKAEFEGLSEIDGKNMIVTVGSFAARVRGLSPYGTRRRIAYGERPTSLNTGFSYLIGSILDGVETAVRENPGIEHIEIRGDEVVNEHLAEFFRSWGFEPVKSNLFNNERLRMQAWGSTKTGVSACAFVSGADPNVCATMGVVGVAMKTVGLPPKSNVRTWVLKVDLPQGTGL